MSTKNDSKITTAIIGTGAISEQHLQFLSELSDVHLVAVCDLSKALARFTSERFGADKSFTDHKKMLNELTPQVVHVLTPPHTHVAIVSDCLEAGANVIVEKPITTNHNEFINLYELAQRKNRLIIENHNYLFNAPILKINQLISDGVLGKVKDVEVKMTLRIRDSDSRYADINYPHPSHKLPAGVLHEFLTHLCYLALHFMPPNENSNGKYFDKVLALWENQGGGNLFKFDELDSLVTIQGVHGHIRFSTNTWPECFSVYVRGTKGSVSTDMFQPYLNIEIPRKIKQLTPLINQWSFGWNLIKNTGKNFIDKLRQRSSYEGLHRFLEITYQTLKNNTSPPISFNDMDRVSRLIDALVAEANNK